MYIYIETSSPRQPGDTARLESPWIRGPQCMTFFYHMYGATVSCVVIYIKFHATNRLKPVWLRCRDQGNYWIQGKISINETSSYQVSSKMFVLYAEKNVVPSVQKIYRILAFIFGHSVCKEK